MACLTVDWRAPRFRGMSGSSPTPSEWSRLVRHSLAGEADAWNALLRHAYPLAQSYLKNLARDPELTRDLTQDLFLRLLKDDARRLRAFDPELGVPFPAYLCVIAHRLFLDYVRSGVARERLRQEPPESLDAAMVVPADAEEKMRLHELNRRIEQLSPQQQTAVRLRADGLSYEEIGRVLGIGTGGVGALLSRARDRLGPLDWL